MRALVTGGTGFIGTALAHRLLDRGDTVRLLVRAGSEPKARALLDRGAELAPGDVRDGAAVLAAAEGCEVAFHLAAQVAVAGVSLADMYATNVDGTEHVLAACERAPVHKLVYVSTESVLVDFTDHAGDETLPFPPRYKDPYSETKAVAERAVMAAHATGRVVATALRPCLVWGPGDTTVLPVLGALARRGLLMWPGGGRKVTTTTYVDNLVHGLILAAERPESAGEVCFLTDDENLPAREFITKMLHACGVDRRFPSVPFGLAMASATVFERVHGLLGFGGQPLFSRYGTALLGCEQDYSCAKAKRVLGYAPVVTVDEGMEQLGEWVRAQGGLAAIS